MHDLATDAAGPGAPRRPAGSRPLRTLPRGDTGSHPGEARRDAADRTAASPCDACEAAPDLSLIQDGRGPRAPARPGGAGLPVAMAVGLPGGLGEAGALVAAARRLLLCRARSLAFAAEGEEAGPRPIAEAVARDFAAFEEERAEAELRRAVLDLSGRLMRLAAQPPAPPAAANEDRAPGGARRPKARAQSRKPYPGSLR